VPVQIENIPGADGIIAFNKFYKEKPDGYTLLTFNIISPIVLELTRRTEYITKEFSSIGAWRVNNFVIDCHPDNWKTFAEFANDAKKKEISLAATGGSANLQGRLLESALGIKFNWVPYKSGQEGIAAVAGKHVDAVITFTVTTMPMVRAGKLNGLLVFTPKRDNFLPGVPTPKELGYNNIACLLVRGGMAAPPKTPIEIVTKLEQTFKKITEDPEFAKMAEKIGVTVDFQSSSEMTKSIPDLYGLVDKYKDVF
jgi:tripartite-type tricarboxylate transporter receptor subunit TctC